MGARLSSDDEEHSEHVHEQPRGFSELMMRLVRSSDPNRGSDEESDEEGVRISFESLRPLFSHINRMPGGAELDQNIPEPVPMDKSCDLYQQIMIDSGQNSSYCSANICSNLQKKQLYRDWPSPGQRVALTAEMLPEHCCLVGALDSRLFCGTYSSDGSMFVSSCQDGYIRLYDTRGSAFKCFKCVGARDVGWSILDTVFSPDQEWLAYSTWSPCVNVASVHSDKHFSLDLNPDVFGSFCAFSIQFSNDGNELFASCNDERVYVYDRTRCERVLSIRAHNDEVNAVNVEGESSHMIYSGGDDGLCKVWDRRVLSESSPRAVGVLAGHKDGITYIDPKGDCRYLITNSKDQTIKLWDLRKFSTRDTVQETLHSVSSQAWDYRWENVPLKAQKEARSKLAGDTSVMTYAGHLVKNTLLRSRFSPKATTGQRYIYTACAKGRVVIYDVLTGEIVSKLQSSKSGAVIRDVSWHPTIPGQIMTSSWDGSLKQWSVNKRPDYVATRSRRRMRHYDNF